MTDLRKAAEMALDALRLYVTMYPQMDKGYMVDARETLRQALAQPEHRFDTPESHIVKWSIPVDPNNFGEALAQPEQDAGKCGCGANLYIDDNGKPCSKAQPEHPLDKKADNARELGLDYEPEQSILICSNCGADRAKEACKGERSYCPFAGQAQQYHGFDRTASHIAGEYVDTAPTKLREKNE